MKNLAHIALGIVFSSLLSAHSIAQVPATTGTDGPTPAPVGQGTLAPTPTPVPTPMPTPAVKYEVPQAQLSGARNPASKGVVPPPPGSANLAFLHPSENHTGDGTPAYFLNGTIHAFHPPAEGYRVQCFFTLKAAGKSYIYAASSFTTPGTGAEKINEGAPSSVFQGMLFALPDTSYSTVNVPRRYMPAEKVNPLAGVTRTSVNVIRVTLSPTPAPNVLFPVDGWIVRIMAGGEILSIAGSSEHLTSVARDNQAYFDEVFELYTVDPAHRKPGNGASPGSPGNIPNRP